MTYRFLFHLEWNEDTQKAKAVADPSEKRKLFKNVRYCFFLLPHDPSERRKQTNLVNKVDSLPNEFHIGSDHFG